MADKRCARCDGSLIVSVSPYTILWSCRYCPWRQWQHRETSPRAITDSDVACAREVDNSPGVPRLASEEPGVAGSSPARNGDPGTPGLTVGAIPAAGAS